MKRSAVLVLAMFALVLSAAAVSISRGSPGVEPLQYDAPQPAAASDWDISSAVILLGILALAGGIVAVWAWRLDKLRTRGVLGNTHPAQQISKDAQGCGKDASPLDALASVG